MRIVAPRLEALPENERPVVVHQAGEKHLEKLQQNYAEAGVLRTAWRSSTTWQGPMSGGVHVAGSLRRQGGCPRGGRARL